MVERSNGAGNRGSLPEQASIGIWCLEKNPSVAATSDVHCGGGGGGEGALFSPSELSWSHSFA